MGRAHRAVSRRAACGRRCGDERLGGGIALSGASRPLRYTAGESDELGEAEGPRTGSEGRRSAKGEGSVVCGLDGETERETDQVKSFIVKIGNALTSHMRIRLPRHSSHPTLDRRDRTDRAPSRVTDSDTVRLERVSQESRVSRPTAHRGHRDHPSQQHSRGCTCACAISRNRHPCARCRAPSLWQRQVLQRPRPRRVGWSSCQEYGAPAHKRGPAGRWSQRARRRP